MSKYISIKQLITNYLLQALSIYTSGKECHYSDNKKIPLYKGRDNNRVLYISGVSLQMSKSHNQTPIEIASSIAFHLSATDGDVFRVQIVPPGWIYLELTHRFLATWLQRLTVTNLGGDEIITRGELSPQNPERLFAIQYAHARCCSLVLLAHREGLIQLKETGRDTRENVQMREPNGESSVTAFWRVTSAEQIPWLNCEEMLRLSDSAEGRLISELVQAVDNLECLDFQAVANWEKVGFDLSQAFESFWCKCRIWGDVKTCSPELAQARVGLVMATQSVLE